LLFFRRFAVRCLKQFSNLGRKKDDVLDGLDPVHLSFANVRSWSVMWAVRHIVAASADFVAASLSPFRFGDGGTFLAFAEADETSSSLRLQRVRYPAKSEGNPLEPPFLDSLFTCSLIRSVLFPFLKAGRLTLNRRIISRSAA